MKNTEITLTFFEHEMKWIEPMLMKYYNKKTKPKTKKELKRLLDMFASTMFNKGAWAIEHDEQYINMHE